MEKLSKSQETGASLRTWQEKGDEIWRYCMTKSAKSSTCRPGSPATSCRWSGTSTCHICIGADGWSSTGAAGRSSGRTGGLPPIPTTPTAPFPWTPCPRSTPRRETGISAPVPMESGRKTAAASAACCTTATRFFPESASSRACLPPLAPKRTWTPWSFACGMRFLAWWWSWSTTCLTGGASSPEACGLPIRPSAR